VARGLFASWNFTAQRAVTLLAVIASDVGTWSYTAPAQSQIRTMTPTDTLGASTRQAMTEIFPQERPDSRRPFFCRAFCTT
jgi:hypothetical protein